MSANFASLPAHTSLLSTGKCPLGRLLKPRLDLAISAATQVVLPFQDASQSASLVFFMSIRAMCCQHQSREVTRTLGDRGVLIQPGDHQELVQALGLAERDPTLCDELGERARRYTLTELSWSKIGAETCSLYRDIARKSQARSAMT